jgi:hypothetical protein
MNTRPLSLEEALDHIRRNGDLLFAPCTDRDAKLLFDQMHRENLIQRNPWSGRLELTKKAALL